MTYHISGDVVNWINILNLLFCVISAGAMWATIALRNSTEHPFPTHVNLAILGVALTYAFSAAAFLALIAGVQGAPPMPELITGTNLAWMIRNGLICVLSVGASVTAWSLQHSPLRHRYKIHCGLATTQGKSAAQIPVVNTAGY